MLFRISIGPDGISISEGGEAKKLTPSPSASQQAPKGCYVYGHFDANGIPFYIGKGTDRRAWSGDRHLFWHRYVNNHLNGRYSVLILEDGLSSDEAEALEDLWIAQESDTLVNWVNFGRKTDFKALEIFHKLRNDNRELMVQARSLEATDLQAAADAYQKALMQLDHYAQIQPEHGLIGRLINEQLSESGPRGELGILDRLTICLCKLGQSAAAATAVDTYFAKYRGDVMAPQAERIRRRVAKTLSRGG